MKALVLCSSPRRNGNSAALAAVAAEGLREAGHEADLIFADDILSSFLRDCRQCRRSDGRCSIDDGFQQAFTQHFLPAHGFIAATPIYWYGMAAQMKAFFDRMFCYVAASHPQSEATKAAMQGKRVGSSSVPKRRSRRFQPVSCTSYRNTVVTLAQRSSELFMAGVMREVM
jgi:multimeric flavodoxin WrbA